MNSGRKYFLMGIMSLFAFLGFSQECLATKRSLVTKGLLEADVLDLEKVFPQLKSDRFLFSDLESAIKFLSEKKNYDRVEVTWNTAGQGASATEEFTLLAEKLPRISKLSFRGLSILSESDARRELSFREGSTLEDQDLSESLQRITKAYQDRGYFNSNLTWVRMESPESGIHLELQVTEGAVTKIQSIVVDSENPEVLEVLRRGLRKFSNEPYTDGILGEIRTDFRERLSEQNFFQTEIGEPLLEFSQDETRIRLQIPITKSWKYFLDFEGALQISSSEITQAIQLEKFSSTNPNLGPEIGLRIKNYYLSQGFARVEVSTEETEGRSKFNRRIKLSIREGPRVKVKDITFSGRAADVNDFLHRRLKELSSPLLARGYFIKEDLDAALENLKVDRQNQGYFKARIISTRVSYSRTKDTVNILINFDEGARTWIQNIQFEGNSLPSKDLLALLEVSEKAPLRLESFEKSLVRLKKHYHDSGYLDMHILNEKEDLLRFNEDNSRVDLVFRLHEGPKVLVGAIIVEGNTLTQNEVVLNELEFTTGDVLTPQKIEESTARLQRLGHFNSVEISTLEEKSSVQNRTIIVRVSDRDPGLFNLGIGANNERGVTLRGYMGVAYRNIRGTGRAASLRIEGKYNLDEIRTPEGTFTFGYLEPYLFKTRNRGRLNYSQSLLVTNYDRLLAADTRQFVLSVEQDLTSHLLLSYDVVKFTRFKDFSLKNEEDFPTNLTDIATTGPTLTIDYRDHPFNPTKGTYTQLSFEYGHPAIGSNTDIEFSKATASITHYWNLSPGLVWANSARGGFLRNQMGKGSVPFDKVGFQLGGLKTIRGYQPNEAFPNDTDLGTLLYRLTDQSDFGLIKSELRYPIYGNVGGTVFYDGGLVRISSIKFDDPYRDSFGLGLRYNTPIGPLTIEYGFKLDRNPARNENPGVLHISIGTF